MWWRLSGASVAVLLVASVAGVAPAAAAQPVNDQATGALVVTSLPYEVALDVSGSTVDADDVAVDTRCTDGAATHSLWFSYTPGYASKLGGWARTVTPAMDMTVAVLTGDPGSLQPVSCSLTYDEKVPVSAGTRYLIRVSLGDPALPAGTTGVLHLMLLACEGSTPGDLDGDACPDLAVGLPGATVAGAARAGAVEVAFGNMYNLFDKRRQRLEPGAALGVPVQPGSAFGAALTQGRLDEDSYEDLAVGIPGLHSGAALNAGAVLVLFGGPDGLGTRRLLLRQGSRPGSGTSERGDRFGATLAISGRVLAVGAPREDVGSAADAGAVVTYVGFTTSGTAPTARLLSQAGAVAGVVEAGDRFGGAIAFGPRGMLLVGVPGEDVGATTDAGAVVTVAPSGASALFSQDTLGMGGVAEAGDGFGSALTHLPYLDTVEGRLAVGVPGEDLGGIRDAGMVSFLEVPPGSSTPRPLARVVTQDTPGVPGVAEDGDRFGSVLGFWAAFHEYDLLVGVPDEDAGTLVDSGAVWALNLPPLQATNQSVRGEVFSQAASNTIGTPEPGDRLGASLATTGADPADEDDGSDSVYAGVPGEDLGGASDAGFVQGVGYSSTVIPATTREPGQMFGAALAELR